MQMRRIEFGFAALLFAFGLFIVVRSLQYGVLGPTVTGAGFFPFLSGLLLMLSTGVILAGHIRGLRSEEDRLELRPMIPVAVVAIATVLFLTTVSALGMILLTPLYVAFVSWVIEKPTGTAGWVRIILTAIGFTAAAWALFDYALSVPLPHGTLFGGL